MIDDASDVARILYKELVAGDIRKLRAESNDSGSGGGARDFRFGSYEVLQPIITWMFPQTITVNRRRGGRILPIDTFRGVFSWYDSNKNVQKKEAIFEPPTDNRPSEGRIVRVHEYPCLDPSMVEIDEKNRVLLLLIQLNDGSVWPYYAEERDLRKPNTWDPNVARELLICLEAKRTSNQVVIGYWDLKKSERYCNGK